MSGVNKVARLASVGLGRESSRNEGFSSIYEGWVPNRYEELELSEWN